MVGPQHKVGVFACPNTSYPIIQVQEHCRIDGYLFEGVDFAQPTIFYRFRRLLIQAPRHLCVVGIYCHDDTGLLHQSGVIGDGLKGLPFVSPPIGEGGTPGAMQRHLVGNLIAFENMGEGIDVEIKTVGYID